MDYKIVLSEFKAGIWLQQGGYRSFSPTKVNVEWEIDSPEIHSLISKAHLKLGELNAFSELIPDVDFFLKMYIAKEATYSGRIEGTETSIAEAFLKSEDILPEERNDWQEIQNYIEAMNDSIRKLETLPFSVRLIKEAHATILQGVRGQKKQPGEFRRSQNWIGGATLSDAVFVPPAHHEIPELMSDLEKFLHNDDLQITELVKVAIGHYQFETIHPFLDGNGRTGRLLIALYLVSKNILNKPSLYLSSFFEKHRRLYYDNLTSVRVSNNMEQWLKFFMAGVIETAGSAVETFRKISSLKRDLELQIVENGKQKKVSLLLLTYLFSQPVVTAKYVEKNLEISTPTANSLIKLFVKLGILNEKTGLSRNRIYAFDEYLELFET